MIAPAIGAQRGQPQPRRIVALAGIGKAGGGKEEPELAPVYFCGAAIFMGQRPVVPQVQTGEDGCCIGCTDEADFRASFDSLGTPG